MVPIKVLFFENAELSTRKPSTLEEQKLNPIGVEQPTSLLTDNVGVNHGNLEQVIVSDVWPNQKLDVSPSKPAESSNNEKVPLTTIVPSKESKQVGIVVPPLKTSPRDVQADNTPLNSIPSKWRIYNNPVPDIKEAVVPLNLECLNNLEYKCQEYRYSLTNSEFLPSQSSREFQPYRFSKPNDGLTDSRFHGLSQAQIKQQLAIPTAGENGVKIPFTNIGIDGYVWDILHGVNKPCSLIGTGPPCPK